jgi:hypothetical protein
LFCFSSGSVVANYNLVLFAAEVAGNQDYVISFIENMPKTVIFTIGSASYNASNLASEQIASERETRLLKLDYFTNVLLFVHQISCLVRIDFENYWIERNSCKS